MNIELLLTAEIQIKKSLLDHFKDGNVLVVDDMPNMRRSIKNMLKYIGIQGKHVFEAGDGIYRGWLKKKDAVQHFKKALEFNPNFAEAKKNVEKN
tara:strand:- start:12108 stop:12392 length:285 start_codon:yes stop_codon:yes gene_type:complete